MSELHGVVLQEKDRREKIDRIVYEILADEALGKELLVKEQLKSARETEQKYLQGITAQQAEEHKAAIEKINLEPKKLIDYLNEQNNTLAKEIKDLQFTLLNLGIHQQEIQKAWANQQTAVANQFAEALKTGNIQVVSPEGTLIELDEKKIEKLRADVFNAPDPVQLCKVIPTLVITEESACKQRAEVMDVHGQAMQKIRLMKSMRDLINDEEALEGVSKLSYKNSQQVLDKNPHIVELLSNIIEDSAVRKAATDKIREAMQAHEKYLAAQIAMKKEQRTLNEKMVGLGVAENRRPRPSPFSSTSTK